MPEDLNQTNQQLTQRDRDSSDSDNMTNFEKESESEMKALAKGLIVDLLWTLSGINRESREKDYPKKPPR